MSSFMSYIFCSAGTVTIATADFSKSNECSLRWSLDWGILFNLFVGQ